LRSDRLQAARLLSGRAGLCFDEKEEILRNVLRRTGRERHAPGRRMWMVGLAGAAAAVVLLVAAGLVWVLPKTDPDELSARGISGSPYGFELACTVGGSAEACRPGGKLIFRLEVPPGRPYFSSFSIRPDGTVVWYFPGSGAASSIDTAGRLSTGVLDLGIELDEEQPPGDYRVFGLFSKMPLLRDQIRSVFNLGEERSTRLFILTERRLTVAP